MHVGAAVAPAFRGQGFCPFRRRALECDEANLKVLLKAYKADKAKDALKSKKSSKGESLKSKKSPKEDEDVPPPHHA